MQKIQFIKGKIGARKRHIAKSITWRVVATTATVIITWTVTGSFEAGAVVGGFEAITKMFLYYAHERAWYRTRFGLEDAEFAGELDNHIK